MRAFSADHSVVCMTQGCGRKEHALTLGYERRAFGPDLIACGICCIWAEGPLLIAQGKGVLFAPAALG